MARMCTAFRQMELARLALATRTTGPSLCCGTSVVSRILTQRRLTRMDARTTLCQLATTTGLNTLVSTLMALCATLATKAVCTPSTASFLAETTRLTTSRRQKAVLALLLKILLSHWIAPPVSTLTVPTSIVSSCSDSWIPTRSILPRQPPRPRWVLCNGVTCSTQPIRLSQLETMEVFRSRWILTTSRRL